MLPLSLQMTVLGRGVVESADSTLLLMLTPAVMPEGLFVKCHCNSEESLSTDSIFLLKC